MSGSYTPFIVASYSAAALILGGLILTAILSYRSAKARLSRAEAMKVDRRTS